MPSGGLIVWLASYPKSGNTWLRLLIANHLADRDAPVEINRILLNGPDLNEVQFINWRLIEEATFVDLSLLRLEELESLRSAILFDIAAKCSGLCFMKVHDQYRIASDGEAFLGGGKARSALCIVRDPRDVAVSLAFHNNFPIDRAIAVLNDPEHAIGQRWETGWDKRRRPTPQRVGDWSSHVASWVDQPDLPIHVLRYEDLRTDPVAVFGAAAAFLGLDSLPERVERAVRFADFAELQRQERQSGFRERLPQSTAPFFRAGRVGAWAEILTTAQSDAITAAHRPMMERFGYL